MFVQGAKTRTKLGWWSNRVGVLAFALTPLTLVVASRNIFSLVMGIPCQNFSLQHPAKAG